MKPPSLLLLVALILMQVWSSFIVVDENQNQNDFQILSTQTQEFTSTIVPTSTYPAYLRSFNPTLGAWSTPYDISDNVTSNWRAFPLTLCDPYQNLHIIWADNIENSSAFYYRNDVGGKLSPPIDILATNDATIHSPAAVISPKSNQLYLVWVNNPLGTLYYSHSSLAGANNPHSWSSPLVLDDRVLTHQFIQTQRVGFI